MLTMGHLRATISSSRVSPLTLAEADTTLRDRVHVSRLDLLTAFLKIGLMGFGGVAPYARRVIVEERQWLSDEDDAAVLGFGEVLPGANTINAAVIIGDRFRGAGGSAIAMCALLAAPVAVLVALVRLYDHFAALPDVKAALDGIAAGAAGLVLGMASRWR